MKDSDGLTPLQSNVLTTMAQEQISNSNTTKDYMEKTINDDDMENDQSAPTISPITIDHLKVDEGK